ncbi:MAG: hypothetical protein Q8916_06770 [Bacteroidota bacterium]|nr:hypothetical protein [Bacteroidota bacterium]MDP4230094.1 hypothetical protein [Bacteroidota bacterium]MDP4236167.1 hypothetical protein [Bacteroidota bacterium]
MPIDVGKIAGQMLAAALPILSSGGANVKDYAETEFKKIAQQIAFIGEQYVAGKLTEAGAKALLEMQVNSGKILLLTIEGLGLLVVEQAINAALSVVKTAVNTALGFALIG